MLLTETIKLIKPNMEVNVYGDQVPTETSRDVFCSVASVGQSEIYQAATVGMKPELKFILEDYLDYEDEPIIEYQAFTWPAAVRYRVIRTYRTGTRLEITCKRGVDV